MHYTWTKYDQNTSVSWATPLPRVPWQVPISSSPRIQELNPSTHSGRVFQCFLHRLKPLRSVWDFLGSKLRGVIISPTATINTICQLKYRIEKSNVTKSTKSYTILLCRAVQLLLQCQRSPFQNRILAFPFVQPKCK